jgi:hypothetical protein
MIRDATSTRILPQGEKMAAVEKISCEKLISNGDRPLFFAVFADNLIRNTTHRISFSPFAREVAHEDEKSFHAALPR